MASVGHAHVETDALLLPRAREIGRLDRVAWGVGSPDRADATFPGVLRVCGAEAHVFQTTLGPDVRASEQPDADVVVLRRQPPGVPTALGYSLEVTGDPRPRAVISSTTDAGARAGLQTLAQLFCRFGRSLPSVQVRDWPAFATRGVMLDVSRCRIPTMDEFGRVIPLLASLKFNHLQFYTEHTFAYSGHREVWDGWDPITPVEMRTLSALCHRHGMSLGANQNCFGHMKHWLDHPRYAPLAETHGEFDFYGMRRQGPFSLCPTDPASRALAGALLDELVPCVHVAGAGSPVVNVGCDETADVGSGRSREAVAARGKAAVYGEHVGAVLRHALARGWAPQFWADIALEHPGVLDAIPTEATALAWGYEGDSPFERWGRVLAERGRDWWVCPGTSSWRSITGRTAERRANIEAAARAGVKHGASGFMICDWGDVGHLQQWPIALAALAQSADAAWTGGQAGFDARATSLHALGEHAGKPGEGLGPWLDRLGDVDEPIRRLALRPPEGRPALRNASALFSVLWPAREELVEPGMLGEAPAWREALERIERAARACPLARDPLVREELAHTLDWARAAARAAIAMREADHGALRRVDEELAALAHRHEQLWAARSRPGGRSQSMAHWDEARRRVSPGLAL